jgi:hypothetical protein
MLCLAQTTVTRSHKRLLQAHVDYTGSLVLYEFSEQILYIGCMHGLAYPVNRPHKKNSCALLRSIALSDKYAWRAQWKGEGRGIV